MISLSRKHLRRGLAICAGGLAALVAAELGYRVLRSAALSPTTHPDYVVHDAELGWAYLPGARARHTSEEFDVEVAFNARGFRGEAWDLSDAEQRRRLLLLGDSFAFGWGVEAEESIGARVDALLPRWQILNAAVSGFGTGQQALLLERLLGEVQPDAVALVFCGNDLFENWVPVAYGKRKPWFELTGGELRTMGQPVEQSWIEDWSLLWRALAKQRWEDEFARAKREPAAEWELTRALLRWMRDRLARGSEPAPPLILLSEEDRLAVFAEGEIGIEHIDLRIALGGSDAPTHFELDGHWNGEGHRLAADALAGVLQALFGAE